MSRFVAKQEPTNDWGVYDTIRNRFISMGLDESEAQEGANNANEALKKVIESK